MSDYEKVNQPEHYQGKGGMTVIQIIQAYECNFAVGNVIKYMLRAGKKPDEDALIDLNKALKYLEFEIEERTPTEKRIVGANIRGYNKNRLQGFEEMGRYHAASYTPPPTERYRLADPSFGNPHLTNEGVVDLTDQDASDET
jgi:hypothetical protein